MQLVLLVLGAGGFLLLAYVDWHSSREAVVSPSTLSADGSSEPVLARAMLLPERHVQRAASTASTEDASLAPRIEKTAAAPRTEREFLEAFLDLERARVGTLDERAQALLSGNGSNAEKVAFLRALEQCGSQQHMAWLERSASSLPDESGPHGVSVARYALERLTAASRTDAAALGALRRLAFETRGLAPDLRRSAALGLAQNASDMEVGELRASLARETDAVLIAGVVAALRDRPASPGTARLLAEFDTLDQGPGLRTDE
jgi:hypothetical protein